VFSKKLSEQVRVFFKENRRAGGSGPRGRKKIGLSETRRALLIVAVHRGKPCSRGEKSARRRVPGKRPSGSESQEREGILVNKEGERHSKGASMKRNYLRCILAR